MIQNMLRHQNGRAEQTPTREIPISPRFQGNSYTPASIQTCLATSFVQNYSLKSQSWSLKSKNIMKFTILGNVARWWINCDRSGWWNTQFLAHIFSERTGKSWSIEPRFAQLHPLSSQYLSVSLVVVFSSWLCCWCDSNSNY